MEVFNWKFKTGNKPLNIIGLGDVHLGSAQCNLDEFKRVVKKIKRTGYKVILLGDLIDCGIKDSPGASVYENNLNPKQQIEEIVKILKPIAPQILSSQIGNHCARIQNSVSLDIMQCICDNLGDVHNGKYQTTNIINVGKETYTVFSTHGSSNATTNEGRINAYKKYLEQIEADVMLYGHVHSLIHRKFEKKVLEKGKYINKSTHMVFCGHFLNYENSYAEFKGMSPNSIGCPLIKLYPDKHKVEIDLEWWKK